MELYKEKVGVAALAGSNEWFIWFVFAYPSCKRQFSEAFSRGRVQIHRDLGLQGAQISLFGMWKQGIWSKRKGERRRGRVHMAQLSEMGIRFPAFLDFEQGNLSKSLTRNSNQVLALVGNILRVLCGIKKTPVFWTRVLFLNCNRVLILYET